MHTVMANTTKRKKKKKGLYFIPVIVLLCIALVITIFFTNQQNQEEVSNETIEDYHQVTYQNKTYEYNTSIVSILLLGIDKDKQNQDTLGQSDAVALLLLDRENKKMSFLAIPRETITEIEMFDVQGQSLGWQESYLNLAYAYGHDQASGCMRTSQAVSRLLNNVPVVRYASMNLVALPEVHDLVGKIQVKVPNDSLVDVNKSWTKGKVVTVTKDNVEDFVRSRDITKNFTSQTRLERQEVYMKAFYERFCALLEGNIENMINKVYNIFKSDNICTNITYTDLKDFCQMILTYDFDESKDYYTLEGIYEAGDVHNTFTYDQEKLDALVIQLFYKEKREKV